MTVRTRYNPVMAQAARPRRKPRAAARAKTAKDKFTADLITRGDAAERDATGKVPRQATHVLTRDAAGRPVVRRVRFKTF
jgi:hypothetical protein